MAKRRRTRKAPEKVPFDSDGNMQRSGGWGAKAAIWRSGENYFLASLALHEHFKYSSSYHITMIDTSTGITYPMFESDFFKMVRKATMYEGEVSGAWAFCKKSNYYGVYLVEEVNPDA